MYWKRGREKILVIDDIVRDSSASSSKTCRNAVWQSLMVTTPRIVECGRRSEFVYDGVAVCGRCKKRLLKISQRKVTEFSG